MKTIKGIIPPMITPLKGDDQIDREGTVRLTEHILAGDFKEWKEAAVAKLGRRL